MTRCGMICMIAVLLLATAGMLICGTRRGRGDGLPRRCAPRNDGRVGKLPTVAGEPIVFRRAELRFVSCRASTEISDETIAARAFSPYVPEQRAAAERYFRKELACMLADQILEAGGIRFQRVGETLRAEIRAVLPEERG